MTQAIEETIVVWREAKKPGTFYEITVPRDKVVLGDVIYNKIEKFYGRIVEMQFKEPGRYSDMNFVVEKIPTFYVFPNVSSN